MATVIHDDTWPYGSKFTKEILIRQLEGALETLRENDTNLIEVSIANLKIEFDTNQESTFITEY